MIHYHYHKPKILFVGINPHYGSFRRGVPFSNNKMLWYLFAEAGLLKESREVLSQDAELKRVYDEKFNSVYGFGFANLIDRPTRDISQLTQGEELPGRRRVDRIIQTQKPRVVCMIGKIVYQKFTGLKEVSFGWHGRIHQSRLFVMHFPLRGEAAIRVRELKEIQAAAS